jgi:hypothetical protein
MEPERSLPCSHEPSTCPHPLPDQSSAHTPPQCSFLKILEGRGPGLIEKQFYTEENPEKPRGSQYRGRDPNQTPCKVLPLEPACSVDVYESASAKRECEIK